MTSRKTSKPSEKVPPAGTRFDLPAESWQAQCGMCGQRRTPLFQTSPETHWIEDPARVCLRCWSRQHREAPIVCSNCGHGMSDELW